MKSFKSRVLFVTFGDGSEDMTLAVKRLTKQAESFHVFASVIGLDHAELREVSFEYQRFSPKLSHLTAYPKYFRVAKCFVIQAALRGAFGDFDQIVYADAGCEIVQNRLSRIRLSKDLRRAQNKPIGLAKAIPCQEAEYSKSKMLDYLNVNTVMRSSPQVQSGVIILNNCKEAEYFVNTWIDLSEPELGLWQDPDIIEKPLIQHRHDQSIFSILWKKAFYETGDFYWSKPRKRNSFIDLISGSYAIHAIQNRTGQTVISTKISSNNVLVFFGFLFYLPISWILKLKNNAKKRSAHNEYF